MSRVLVTGGAGFIGSHLVDALVAQHHRVIVVDDLSSGRRTNLPTGIEFLHLDVRSPRILDVFRDFKPTYVFHLAAQKNVRASVADPRFDADVNISGSLNIIDHAARARVKKIIFASTGGAIYGPTKRIPTPESVHPMPESPYAIAKHTIEQYLRFYRQVHGLASMALRFGNVYGPRQDPKGEAGVVAIFAQRLLANQPLMVNGTGRQTRDYVYVSDVVAANLRAMLSPRTGEVNIGTGKPTSVNTIVRKMLSISGHKVPVRRGPQLAGEVMASTLRIQMAKKILRWKPVVGLDEGLARVWAWAEGEAT